jgi:hypothetical protein
MRYRTFLNLFEVTQWFSIMPIKVKYHIEIITMRYHRFCIFKKLDSVTLIVSSFD